MAITSMESLQRHLQWALELEHATIPPYLCALYSIKPGQNTAAVEIITSVFIEEMLHMTLVANLLNAIGASPVLDKPDFVPTYPTPLPHSDKSFLVSLKKFSPEALEDFLKIERPAQKNMPAADENYHTIGQFYQAIADGIEYLAQKIGEQSVFTGDPAKQITSEHVYYGGAGHLLAVTELASARAALQEIVDQGEGLDHNSILDGDKNMFHPEREEVGHYFRFQQILAARAFQPGDTAENGPTGSALQIDWDQVYNMWPNPSVAHHAQGSAIRTKMGEFNREYFDMLRMLERSFNGDPELMRVCVGTMYELKEIAIELMQMPCGDGGMTAGPSFEYVPADKPEANDQAKIVIRPNGPYTVHGSVPLTISERIASSKGETLAWHMDKQLQTDGTYELCRCGQSSSKPFCDGTHARIDFDGTETADARPIAERQETLETEAIMVRSDRSVCMHASFCNNKATSMRKLLPDSADTTVCSQIIAMVEHCPSGALTYSLNAEEIEPKLPQEISVVYESAQHGGPLWVTGGIPIERADGEPVENRNRVTLCRCGASKNKPFCDGSHNALDWNP